MKMKEIMGEDWNLSDSDLTGIANPRLTEGELYNLLQEDPLLQRMIANQEGLAHAVNEEFMFFNYCLAVLDDRKARTRMFLEQTDEDVKSLLKEAGLKKHIAPILYARKMEVFPQVPGYKDYAKTSLHHISTTLMAEVVGRTMGLPKEDRIKLLRGMVNHDIGKYALPLDIVNKPGLLAPEEREIMQMHPELGNAITATTYDLPQESMEVILYHHERLDGSGYPYGLEGDDIPLFAQIAGVVDVFDALIEDRPYRPKSYSVREALGNIITDSKRGRLNKDIVDCLVAANRESRASPRETGYYPTSGAPSGGYNEVLH